MIDDETSVLRKKITFDPSFEAPAETFHLDEISDGSRLSDQTEGKGGRVVDSRVGPTSIISSDRLAGAQGIWKYIFRKPQKISDRY